MYSFGKVVRANEEVKIDTTYINARIATNKSVQMVYVPKHKKGKDIIPSKLLIPILINEFGIKEPQFFTLVATDKLADVFAKNLNKGKEMTFFCKSKSRIVGWLWGADSRRTIEEETDDWENDIPRIGMASGEGYRHKDWNKPGTEGNRLWKEMMECRKKRVFTKQEGENGFFGFARVAEPKGKIIYED